MRDAWKHRTFKDICISIEDGDWIEKKDQSSIGIRLIQTGNIGVGEYKDKSEKAKHITEDTFRRLKCTKVTEGDILISRLPDPVGRACIVPHLHTKCITAVDCSILKIKRDIVLPQWFIYYTQSSEYFSLVRKECSGTTRDRISRKKLEVINIPIPSLSEQQRIVGILDAEFEKIDALKANAEKNLQNAKDLFVKTMDILLLPKENWQDSCLCTLCNKIGSGATPSGGKKSYGKEGISLIRSMNVYNNEFRYEDLAHINDKQASLLANVEVSSGDVLFNITGASVTRCCLVPDNVIPARVNQHVSILRVKQDMIIPQFLVFTLISERHNNPLMKMAENGATRQAITKKQLEEWHIQYPTIKEQQDIIIKLNELSDRCNNLQDNYIQTIALCDDLKQALLRKAFSGEL